MSRTPKHVKTARLKMAGKIYCCACEKTIRARLTDGAEVYPHRPNLAATPFWRCDACGNCVGCHHQTDEPTRPLGCIATKEVKEERRRIHWMLDPLWRSGRMDRQQIYDHISKRVGRRYHTANIRSLHEARRVRDILHELRADILAGG